MSDTYTTPGPEEHGDEAHLGQEPPGADDLSAGGEEPVPSEGAPAAEDRDGALDPTAESPDEASEPEGPEETETEAPGRIDLDLPPREPTGDEQVDAALDRLDEARGGDIQAHLDAAETAQDALQQRLADTRE